MTKAHSSTDSINKDATPMHTGVALNHAESHENKIHSDELAARFGFEGALVPGVTVFGLTSIALTKQLGTSWLHGNTLHTRFLKPAYHNDRLNVFLTNGASTSEARCVNKDQTLLCTLQLDNGVSPPEFQKHGFNLAAEATPATRTNREVISWDVVKENEHFPSRPWHPNLEENAKFANEVQDTHSGFTRDDSAFVHPHLLLSQANQALVDQFEMPAWIHVGSEIRMHQPLTVATDYRIFATPVRKWRHKGHEFVTAYIAYEHGGEAHTEILHTAIFSIAGT